MKIEKKVLVVLLPLLCATSSVYPMRRVGMAPRAMMRPHVLLLPLVALPTVMRCATTLSMQRKIGPTVISGWHTTRLPLRSFSTNPLCQENIRKNQIWEKIGDEQRSIARNCADIEACDKECSSRVERCEQRYEKARQKFLIELASSSRESRPSLLAPLMARDNYITWAEKAQKVEVGRLRRATAAAEARIQALKRELSALSKWE